jgi:hypothetical protein
MDGIGMLFSCGSPADVHLRQNITGEDCQTAWDKNDYECNLLSTAGTTPNQNEINTWCSGGDTNDLEHQGYCSVTCSDAGTDAQVIVGCSVPSYVQCCCT